MDWCSTYPIALGSQENSLSEEDKTADAQVLPNMEEAIFARCISGNSLHFER
jgi:hypothetical protein